VRNFTSRFRGDALAWLDRRASRYSAARTGSVRPRITSPASMFLVTPDWVRIAIDESRRVSQAANHGPFRYFYRTDLGSCPRHQDSVSAFSDTAVRGSSIDRIAQSANAPIAYGAVWTIAASHEWPFR